MTGKRLTAEQMVTMLLQIEALQAQIDTIAVACSETGTLRRKDHNTLVDSNLGVSG